MEVAPALSAEPVFIDGLSTTLSYVILAVKHGEVYNCVCLRNNGTFKFYPNFEFWGVTPTQLKECGLKNLYDRAPYQGNHSTSSDAVKKVLGIIRGQRQTVVVPDELIAGVFETAHDVRSRNRELHPASRGYAPRALPTYQELKRLPRPAQMLALPYSG